MDEFHGRGEFHRRRARRLVIAAEHRPGDGHHRAHPFAAGRDQMAGKLRHQRHLAVHPLQDCGVHPRHLG